MPPSYIRVRAVVWAYGRGQAHRQTHRRVWPQYILRRLRLTQNVTSYSATEIRQWRSPVITRKWCKIRTWLLETPNEKWYTVYRIARYFRSAWVTFMVISERRYAVARPSVCRLSVCLSSVVCLSSLALVHPTQAVAIFGNISTAFGNLGHPLISRKKFTEIVPGKSLCLGN